jgi:hypothetical protein
LPLCRKRIALLNVGAGFIFYPGVGYWAAPVSEFPAAVHWFTVIDSTALAGAITSCHYYYYKKTSPELFHNPILLIGDSPANRLPRCSKYCVFLTPVVQTDGGKEVPLQPF